MNTGEPLFVTRDQIERLHESSLAKFGGAAGVRDEGLIEAIAKKTLDKAGLAEIFRRTARPHDE